MPSPSPDYLQEIQNVGDNINLLNKKKMDSTIGLDIGKSTVLETGRRLTAYSTGAYRYGVFKLGGKELLGKTLSVHANIATEGGTPNISIYVGNSSSLTQNRLGIVLLASGTGHIDLPSTFPVEGQDTISAVLYVTAETSVPAGTYVDYTDLKIQIGDGEVAYSAYNCGSVGITVSNRNLFNPEWLVPGNLSSSGEEFAQNGYARTTYISVEPNENLSITMFDTTNLRASALHFYDKNKNWIKRTFAPSNVGWNNFSTIGNCKYIRFTIGVVGSKYTTFTEEALQEASNNLQLERGVSTSYIPHEEQAIIFPLTEEQKLYEGSYLAKDGIHQVIKMINIDFDSYTTTMAGEGVLSLSNSSSRRWNYISIKGWCSHFKNANNENITANGPAVNNLKDNEFNFRAGTAKDRIYFKNSSFKTLDNWKNFFENNNVMLAYEAEEEIIPYTDEQQTVYNQLQNLSLYEGVNNFSFESGLYPISTLTYNIIKASPAPDNPSEVYFTGDIGNQIDFPDTSVSYTDGLHVAAKPNNNCVLLPNRIYTLNFDYVVTNSTTDIYYGIGYGTENEYVGALTINGEENIQYATQNTGTNSLTFQTPAIFEGVDTPYLWIDFAKTIITATVAVDVSNVSLYFGEYTPYQEYGKYNIPFKVLGQNLFNYQKLLYFIDNNTTHELISNGYSVNPTVQDSDCYVSIGYTNNFIAGEKYTLSYQTLGNVTSFNLYAVEKGTSEIANEITLTNGVFVAPDNNYDLMLKFILDSSDLTNNVNIWNIQIAKGEENLDYVSYTENGLDMDFEQPLRSIGKIKDCILLDTVNLLNPTTLRANVKENTTYYFSSSTSNSYLLEFYNIENNLIDTEDISSGTFTTPANCVYVTSEDFTTLNVIPEQIQIEEGDTFSQYFPYITQPSVIRNVGRIIVNGTEDWAKNETVTASNAFYLHNSLVPSYKQNALGICTHYKTISDISATEGIFYGVSINICTALSYNYTVTTFKTWLAEQNTNGNPVVIYYQLSTPQVYNLSSDYATTLRNFTTQVGTNNILIDSQYPGYLTLKYANSYTDQETKANYVLLKCWNENTIPYVIHSNYITVKSPTEKIFIWTRRKNNIFDLRMENLGEE